MERTSSASWVKGLADMFAAAGIDVPALFLATGVDIALLDQPEGRIPGDQVSDLWDLAVARSGNAALGIDQQLAQHFVNFDLLTFPMLSSPDLRTGLESLSHYMALVSDATSFELVPDHGRYWFVVEHIGHARPVPRQRQEHALLAVLTLCRWITRRNIQPLLVESRFAPPIDLAPYEAAFECPMHFDRPVTRLLLAGDDLSARLPSRNLALLPLLQREMDDRLASLGLNSMSRRVTDEIVRRLPHGEPRREDIARFFAMADRTLQRRLHAEQASFQALLDDARRDLAQRYLAERRHTLGQIASLLGFADQSNFFRASRRWFGVSPGQYRERLAGATCMASGADQRR